MTDKRTQSSPDIIKDLTKKNPLLYGAIFLMLGSQGFDFAGSNAVLQEVKQMKELLEEIDERSDENTIDIIELRYELADTTRRILQIEEDKKNEE